MEIDGDGTHRIQAIWTTCGIALGWSVYQTQREVLMDSFEINNGPWQSISATEIFCQQMRHRVDILIETREDEDLWKYEEKETIEKVKDLVIHSFTETLLFR